MKEARAGEDAEHRQRTEIRLRYLEIAQDWDEDGFWQGHAAEKGIASLHSAPAGGRPVAALGP
jgi:hypothetical protein